MTGGDARRIGLSAWGRLRTAFLAALGKSAMASVVMGVIGGGFWLLSVVWSPVEEIVWGYVRTQIGFTAMAQDLDELRRRVSVLEPREEIAVYDPNLSYVEGDACRVGGDCTARFRVYRTARGRTCGAPALVPLVRNHGGVEHVAEPMGVSAEADGRVIAESSGGLGVIAAEDWTVVTVRFRVPQSARPGRGVYLSRLLYTCDGVRLAPVETIPLPFRILPSRPD